MWTVTALKGTVGRSDIAGHVTVRKIDGRTKLDGGIVSNAFDFDDLTTPEGRARGLAKSQALGPRLVPDTRINLRKIGRTDGTLTFTAKRLISDTPSALRAMRGTVTMDHQLMTVAPFRLDLRRGRIEGSVIVDQRGGPPVPLVTIDLALRDSSITALAGGAEVDGYVEARARLKGTGSTIREVVGRSDGTIGLVARDGTLPAKIASLLGFDAVRGILTDEAEQAGLRCAVLHLDVRRGVGRVDPFTIDTTRSQTNGQGTIIFPSEAIAMQLTGAPKAKTILRFPGSLTVGGSIKEPDVRLPADAKSAGNFPKGARPLDHRQTGPARDRRRLRRAGGAGVAVTMILASLEDTANPLPPSAIGAQRHSVRSTAAIEAASSGQVRRSAARALRNGLRR